MLQSNASTKFRPLAKSLKLVAAINSNLKVIIISNVNPIYNTELNTKFP